MLEHHHPHGILRRAEERSGRGPAAVPGALELLHVREQHLLFFEHVREHVGSDVGDQRDHSRQFRTAVAVNAVFEAWKIE